MLCYSTFIVVVFVHVVCALFLLLIGPLVLLGRGHNVLHPVDDTSQAGVSQRQLLGGCGRCCRCCGCCRGDRRKSYGHRWVDVSADVSANQVAHLLKANLEI